MRTATRQQLAKRVRFSAAHLYYREDWSLEKNEAVFGACAHKPGHGHNYWVDVILSGDVDSETGMIINFDTLEPLLDQEITRVLDHKHLNRDIAFFKNHIPTLGNITQFIWQQLATALDAQRIQLAALRVWESDDLYAERLALENN